MEQEKVKKQLPDSIVLQDEYGKMQKSWLALLGNAQRAYDYLLSNKDVGDCLPEFDKLDSAWIKSFVQQKVDAVMQSPNTYNARIEAVNEWKELEKDLLTKIKAIEELRGIDSDLQIELRGSHIVIGNMKQLLKVRAEFIIPDSFKEFYAIACECAASIQRLREKQQAWGVAAFPVLNSVAVQLAGNPTEFVNFCIGLQKQQEWLANEKKPSKFALQIRQHEQEMKKLEAERQKRFEKARLAKIKKGEQVDFGVSERTIEGRLIPVSGHKD